MDGSIHEYLTKKGKMYYVSYRVEILGKKEQKSKRGFKTKRDAKEFLNEIEYQIRKGSYIADDKITLAEYLDEWMLAYQKQLKETSVDGYKINIHHIEQDPIGYVQLQKLRSHDIQNFYTRKMENGRLDGRGGLSEKSIRYIHRVLSKALKDGVKHQRIKKNPATDVNLPKPKKYKASVYNKEEIQALLHGSKGTELELPILLSVSLGLRRGEILGMTWDQIDFQNKSVTINKQLVKTNSGEKLSSPKTDDSIRTLALPNNLINYLQDYKSKQGEVSTLSHEKYPDKIFLCCKPSGEPLRPDYVSQGFARLLKRLGLKHIRFHDLRHSFATVGLASGAPLKVISELLGHSTIGITADIYSHVLNDVKIDALNTINSFIFGE